LLLQSVSTGVLSAATLNGMLTWPVAREQQQGPAAAAAAAVAACRIRSGQGACRLLLLLQPRSKAACLIRLAWGAGMRLLQQQRRRRAGTCQTPLGLAPWQQQQLLQRRVGP
jgi:hypothetical protein